MIVEPILTPRDKSKHAVLIEATSASMRKTRASLLLNLNQIRSDARGTTRFAASAGDPGIGIQLPWLISVLRRVVATALKVLVHY
jgi:hypothetical protein